MRKFITVLLLLPVFIFLIHAINCFFSPIYSGDKKIRVERGTSLQDVAKKLQQKEIIQDTNKFIFVAYIKGKVRDIKAGYFSTKNVNNYSQLVDLLTGYNPYTVKVTVPEGSTTQNIARIMAKKFDFTQSEFLQKTKDASLIDSLDIKADIDKLEGYLFPDTYFFYPSSRPQDIIKKMVHTLFEKIDGELYQQIQSSSRDLHGFLTLASLVEGECVIDSERTIVASLYLNRLEERMHLNADPTIQYIVPGKPRRLLNKHLEIDSPYNTYENYGLPPGPVNNPGLKSIQAAVNPADTDYLYMVARGDGGHEFTVSYEKFLEEKEDFQHIRQQVSRNKN